MVQLTGSRRVGALRRRFLCSGPEQGAVAVVVAIMMIVLVMCAAIVVDLGNARDVRRQSQNAADASALAGVNALYPTSNTCAAGPETTPPCWGSAAAAVKSFAAANFSTTSADWTACSVTSAQSLTYTPTGESSCISFDSATSPKKVRVWLPARSVSTFFGGVTGRSTIPVGSQADAVVANKVKCTLCFLGSVEAENADFSVIGGSIAVNGDVDAGPNSNWLSQANVVVGTVNGGNFTPAPTPIQPFTDPLAGALTLPIDISSLPLKSDPCLDGPGRYGALDLPNGPCTLQPGFYGITGEWESKNNTNLNGTGVTLYAQAGSGYLNFRNGSVTLTPQTTGTYAGYTVIYDRTNTQPLSLQGNGGTSISGIVYAPASALDFNGNSCFGFSGGPVVVGGVNLANGNTSCVTITNPVDTEVARTPLHLTQ